MSKQLTAQQRIEAHRQKLLKKQGLQPAAAPTPTAPPEPAAPITEDQIEEFLSGETPNRAHIPDDGRPPYTDEELRDTEPVSPATMFRDWLRTPEGQDASDPRMPNDAVRRAVFLEDALEKAFLAGFNKALQ